MEAPNFSLQRLHTSAHRLLGMWDTFVMGSIFSGLPMLTWAGRQRGGATGCQTGQAGHTQVAET